MPIPKGIAAVELTLATKISRLARRNFLQALLLFALFFFVCFGLGYPTLNRYDPAGTDGTSDSARYYQMIVDGPQEFGLAEHVRGRLLVPYLAKPIYHLALNRTKTWNPVFFALLIVNSFFTAVTAVILACIGCQLTKDRAVALLAAALYLLNFVVSNMLLSGLVDSAEACFMIAITWALLNDRWLLLLPLAALGAAAKETFVPLASTFALVWWMATRSKGSQLVRGFWVAAMIIAGLAVVMILQSLTADRLIWPWTLVSSIGSGGNYLHSLWRCIAGHEIEYTLIWLLPLGVWRLNKLPPPWVRASFITMLLAFALGAYRDTLGSVARPLFNVIGPILSLSVAMLLTCSSLPLTASEQSIARNPES